MFNKNQNSSSDNGMGIDQVPVHTMQDDLNSLGKSGSTEKFIKLENSNSESNAGINGFTPSEKKSDSPFLNNNSASDYPAPSSLPPAVPAQPVVRTSPIPVRPILQSSSAPARPVPNSLPVQKQAVPSPIPSISANKAQKVKEEKEMFLKELEEKREIEREERENNTISQDEAGKPGRSGKILFLLAGIVIIIIFFGGGYYFWATRTNDQAEDNIISETENKENVEVQNENTKPEENTSKFSLSNPNVLSVNTENPDFTATKQNLIKTANDIKAENISVPLEFIVTDKDNNPISFVDFTLAFGIKLPAEILSYTNKDFSLYYYNDAGNMRLGLLVEVREAEKVKALMRKEENNLYKDLSPLFLENVILKTDRLAFADGNYNGNPIRYANLDAKMIYSIDYTLRTSQLVLGTSKMTTRSILDRSSNLSSK